MFSMDPELVPTSGSSTLNQPFCGPGKGANSSLFFRLHVKCITPLVYQDDVCLLLFFFQYDSSVISVPRFYICSACGLITCFSLVLFVVHQSFLICPWRVLNSLQTLFNFFLFPLLGNLKLFVPECSFTLNFFYPFA